MLPVYRIDPLKDERWVRLVQDHPAASIFHTRGWLQALKSTYGYQPVAFTTSEPGRKLTNGIVFCRISSWITGSRLVSLPFSDHCQPLVDCRESLDALLASSLEEIRRRRSKYLEIRPLSWPDQAPDCSDPYSPGDQFYFHSIDLQPDLDFLFRSFHKSCIQRKIRKVGREDLTYEAGRSDSLVEKFYGLLILTRRRHQLPPQPFKWFRNLTDCLGDRLTIRLVSKDGQPVASILTLAHGKSLVYKYGCSDDRFHNLGGMPFLFWNTIQEAKQAGFLELDLGRSELDNSGLIQFKNHLGGAFTKLTYRRYPEASPDSSVRRKWGGQAVRYMFSRVPDSVLVLAGSVLYRHLG